MSGYNFGMSQSAGAGYRGSPFPGTDPWLDGIGGDVHLSLIAYTRDQLQGQLPPELVARSESRVSLDYVPPEQATQSIHDVMVAERPGAIPRLVAPTSTAAGGQATAEPMRVQIAKQQRGERFLQIIDLKTGGRVVTVIEFLGRSNKLSSVGRREYIKKHRELRASETNLVEIDLARGGRPVTLASRSGCLEGTPYLFNMSVLRARQGSTAELYPVALADPLPEIRVPLRSGEADVRLNLQAVFEEVYARGRYELTDYASPLAPPLDPVTGTWARERIDTWQAQH